jgi:hypothetical protein
VDIDTIKSLFANTYGPDENLFVLGLAFGLGVWWLSSLFIGLGGQYLSSDWWTFVAALLISGSYWLARMLAIDDGISNALLDFSEGMVILSLSWIAAKAYRSLWPHLVKNLISTMERTHKEHFAKEEDNE